MISPVFWTFDLRFAFQYVDGYWRVYDEVGDFVIEFRTYEETFEYIAKVDKQLQSIKQAGIIETE